MKGIIIVHGTSQDITSIDETTVQIAKAAQSEGHLVVQIGGPGSTERALLRGLKRAQHEYVPIDEIGLPLDYAWDIMAGTATGAGIDDIVEDIKAAAFKMLRRGVSEIQLVGFSRGAVALAMALDVIGKEMGSRIKGLVPITVCLLDPVPGPYLVPKKLKIPSYVDRCLLLTSKHEGRPGFIHLDLSVDIGVKFSSDLVMGVHGDIGGSTKSSLTRVIKDDVAKFMGLAGLRLSAHQRRLLLLEIITDSSQYTNPGIAQWMHRRAIGWSPYDFQENIIELPTAGSLEDLKRLPSPPAFWERDFQQRLRRFEERELPMLIVPSHPIVNYNRDVVFRPSRPIRLKDSTTVKAAYHMQKHIPTPTKTSSKAIKFLFKLFKK